MVGFFQVMNHGIPGRVLEMMLEGARRFHELPREVKAEYYTREFKKNVKFIGVKVCKLEGYFILCYGSRAS